MANSVILQNGRALGANELDAWANTLRSPEAPAANRHIGILAPSSPEFVAALLGTWQSGQVAVPLQPAHPLPELAYIVKDSAVPFFWYHSSLRLEASRLASETGAVPLEISALPEGTKRQDTERHPLVSKALQSASPEAGALLIYTSGTTNRPKGVVIQKKALLSQISTLRLAWGWQSTDKTLNTLPLHHVHGLVNILCCALESGAQCELLQRFEPDVVWNRISNHEISVFMGVPTIYQKLIHFYEQQSTETQSEWSRAANSLRLMVSGSSALPISVFHRWEKITGHRLLERYGMTEIGMALSNPYRGSREPGTVGQPLPGVQVRLSHEGEIQVQGPTVFKEYWNRPEETESSFTPDGFFKTGDLAEVDATGYYRILGRISQDIIKCGGFKISALEIESALLEHSEINEAAVVGLPDSEWGERVAAVCVTKPPGMNGETLGQWLKGKLAHYKVPTRWLFTEALPRNAMGKVTKKELKALFQ